MPLSPSQFKERIDKAKRADIKAVIESTGAQPVRSNQAKGEFTYHAPYREDSTPSLVINIHQQSFCDFGQTDASGDVIKLTRLIFGRGDAEAFPFFEALKWLDRFSGGSVAPAAIKPRQPQKKPVSVDPVDGQRFIFIKAVPVSNKTHPSNLAYIEEIRKISRPIASRYLEVIQYKDNAAPIDDPLRGNRYGIGGRNDSGVYELRAPRIDNNFKLSLGPKDVSSFAGHPAATTGHIFEGRFDFLTRLQITGETHNYHPTIVLNTGALAARAAQVIKSREDWSQVKNWHIYQDNDNEGDRSTAALIDALGEGYTVGTMNHLYEGFKDLNQCWTDAEPERRRELTMQMLATGKKPAEPESKSKVQPDNTITPRY